MRAALAPGDGDRAQLGRRQPAERELRRVGATLSPGIGNALTGVPAPADGVVVNCTTSNAIAQPNSASVSIRACRNLIDFLLLSRWRKSAVITQPQSPR